jgi:hypothetical protein
MPQRFFALKPEQQAGVRVALQHVEANLQQAVLDEWDTRCQATSVRRPAGYLFGIIQKAMRGEFNTRAAHAPPPVPAVKHPVPPETPDTVTHPEQARHHLAQLREMLR